MVAQNAAVCGERAVSDPPRESTQTAHARRIQADYGRWAAIYDWFARATSSVGGVRSGSISALGLSDGDTVVEFGCGPGPNLPALREAVGPSGHVVGVDITRPMLTRARALVTRRGWENVSLVHGDATAPPVREADAVLATFVTSLFPDPYAVVSGWCDLADTVVLANFVPQGNRAANAALWLFTQLNPPLFDSVRRDTLGQLDRRTGATRRALVDKLGRVETDRYVFGIVSVNAGYREQ
ncbi:class I SAM-dependent methyltransferase [Halolamina sp.]|uniref:class I SAM-dependent methyltransferase n=1 Tax=Halolamina sp. TaxID=1940283 RepID=UPI000223C0FE|nr:Methyltransferase type 11 [halophilic archaeon DL31]